MKDKTECFKEMFRNIPLSVSIKTALTMADYGNWENGSYLGNKKLIKRQLKYSMRNFKEKLESVLQEVYEKHPETLHTVMSLAERNEIKPQNVIHKTDNNEPS